MRRLCLILLGIVCLTACIPSQNLDEYAYVLNVGAERGTTMPYLVTFLVSAPGEGTEQTEISNIVISAEARTFSEAVQTLNAAYPSRLSFSRASLLLLSEDLVREGGQTPFLDFSFGAPDLWQNLRIAVCEGSVQDTFEGWTSDTDPSLRKIKTSVGELSSRSALTADIGYSTYLECVRDGRIDALVTYAGKNEWTLRKDMVGEETYPYLGGSLLVSSILSTSTAGSAVFDGDRMVGVLDGQHTMAAFLVIGAFQSGQLLCTLSDGTVMQLQLKRIRRPKIGLSDRQASAKVYLEADLIAPQTLPMTGEELIRFLKAYLEQMLQRVYLALRAANSDAMGFGRAAVKQFRTVEEWEAYDWKAAYRNTEAEFTVHIRLAHTPRGSLKG